MRISDWSSDVCSSDLCGRPARNWWKIGFFVMLIMFEAAREWAVAMTYEPPKISSGFYVGRVETLVSATGRWKRTEKGSELVPGDRKSVVEGKSVSVRVDLGGRRIIKQKTKHEE